MNRALSQIVAKAMSQDKLPSSLLVKFNPGEQNNYEATMRLLSNFREDDRWQENVNFVLNASYTELLKWVTEFESKTSFDELMLDTKPFEKLTDVEKEQYLKDSANLISPNSPPEQVVLDLLNINSSFEALAQRAVQPQDFERIFNPAYFQSVKKVFEANPIIGRKVAQDAVRVIDSQSIAIARALESEANQLGFRIQAGTLVPDPELMPVEYTAIVQMHFGGDWDAALAARGTDAKGYTYNPIRAMTNTIRNDLAPKVKKFQEATRVVDQLKGTFLTEDITGPLEGGAGTDALQGGEGEDFIPTTGNELTLDLIREKEGFREKAYWDVNAWRTGYGSDTVTRADGTVETVTEDTVVTREDAERDLARRTREFQLSASRKIGTDIWTNMPGNVTAALTSIAYNYGSIPDRILKEARSGDWNALATAVEKLAGDNKGINRKRRMREAALIRGKELPPSAAPVYSAPPRERPAIDTAVTATGAMAGATGAGMDSVQMDTAEGEAPSQAATEAPRASTAQVESARRVWGTLAEETQRTLARILGSEEEAIRMLAEKEITEEDMRNF
jgi:GH24 family phage-related lysozyme (muramidase)